jgi:hypothetical protein
MINRIPAAPYLGIFLLLPLCWGCASFDSRPKSLDETDLKFERYARKIHQSFEMGKALSPGDPLFVEQQGELVLAETLRTFYSPYAGAQQLLSFTKRHPRQSLLPLYLEKDPIGRYFEFQDDEDF